MDRKTRIYINHLRFKHFRLYNLIVSSKTTGTYIPEKKSNPVYFIVDQTYKKGDLYRKWGHEEGNIKIET